MKKKQLKCIIIFFMGSNFSHSLVQSTTFELVVLSTVHVLITVHMLFVFLQWCLYLQDSVVREIYNIAGSERNQQSLCQVTNEMRKY